MKKTNLFWGTILALAAASCTMEENNRTPQPVEQEITIKAVREGDEADTRTYRDDNDGSIWWVPGDAISLFYGSGTNGGSKFTSTGTDTAKVTNFTGVITAITGGGEISVEDTYFWGLYPYSEDASCDGTSVTMTLPGNQTAVPGTFATNTFPSIGRSQGLIMGFYNICSGMKFSVTNEGIKKVTLKSGNSELITGKAKVRFDNGVPVTEIIDGSDEVVLVAPAGEYFEVGKYYFLVMFPTTFTNGFTVTLETFTEEATVEKTGKITARRSNFGRIADIDANAAYNKKTSSIPVVDANFKAYLVENFDGNGDGEIDYEEALTITEINVCTDNIDSLTGIGYMPHLTSLTCRGSDRSTGKLTKLDLSENYELTFLDCTNNNLTSLNLTGNTELTTLECDSNQLTSIDLSNNPSLLRISCHINQLTNLDVSNNTKLTYLACGSNELTSLDISNNPKLTGLWCGNNRLTDLNLSNNLRLEDLDCGANPLEELDLSALSLKNLYCYANQLSNLDVSGQAELTDLYCYGNQLSRLDISNNTKLVDLVCEDNLLTNLNVSENILLGRLACSGNRLTNLNVSKNIGLTSLFCSRMNDSNGDNLLAAIFIHQGQEIPNVTSNRSEEFIPAETQIVVIPDNPVPDIVDLGLSVKWASFNLGAFMPEQYGKNYCWGMTGSADDGYLYTWENEYYENIKYNSTDNRHTLKLEDDAANTNLGGLWRMPTHREMEELLNIENCTWTWTTRNGVKGYEVVSRINGNSIFLPVDSGGESACLWSSECPYDYSYTDQAAVLIISQEEHQMYLGIRGVAHGIRPVYGEWIHVESVSITQNTLSLTVGDQVELETRFVPDNAHEKSLFWTSSDESVASVSKGVVTALRSGSATITATTVDGGKTATCTVNVTGTIPLNQIWYTTDNGESVTPSLDTKFYNANDEELTYTNLWVDNKWVMEFSDNISYWDGFWFHDHPESMGNHLKTFGVPTGLNPEKICTDPHFNIPFYENDLNASIELFYGDYPGIADKGHLFLIGKNYTKVLGCATSFTGVITVPEGVTHLGFYAFHYSRMSRLILPSSIVELGEYCLEDCDLLTDIYCYAPDCPITYDDIWMYNTSTGKLHYPNGSDYSGFILPSSWSRVPIE